MSSQDEELSEKYFQACEEISEAYEAFLESIAEEDEIGLCGFPCDGGCDTCKGTGTFDSTDEY